MFSPVTTHTTLGNLFPDLTTDAPTVEQTYRDRHRIMGDFFASRDKLFALQAKGKEYHCKMLANRDGVIVFKVANSRKWKHELDFNVFDDRDEPSCNVIIDNRPEGIQSICIQNKTTAFKHPRQVAAILEEALNPYLKAFRLQVGIKAKYHTSEFWQTLDKHPEGIDWIEFHFPYPNMPEITDKVRYIEELARETNSEPSLRLVGQNKENVVVNRRVDFITQALEACAASGKSILIKPKKGHRVEIGTLCPVKEELPDAVFKRLGEADLFTPDLQPLLEFLKGIKLWYDE